MKNKFLKILVPLLLAPPLRAFAICPICAVGTAAGVWVSRWLGIDDSITGLWIGGLTLSLTLWFLNWLKKKKINFPLKNPVVFFLFYALTILSLYWTKLVGYSCQKLWGVNKLILGLGLGTLGFALGMGADYLLRKKNNGKVYFPFQKIVLPISFLIILSAVFYFITK